MSDSNTLCSADTIKNQHQTFEEARDFMVERAQYMRQVSEEALHQGQFRFQEMLLDLANNYPIEMMCEIADGCSLEQVFGEDVVQFSKATKMLFDCMCEFDKVGQDG